MSLYGKPKEEYFGVNIEVDTGTDDAAKMNWWGAKKDFNFDTLVTAWVMRGNGAILARPDPGTEGASSSSFE